MKMKFSLLLAASLLFGISTTTVAATSVSSSKSSSSSSKTSSSKTSTSSSKSTSSKSSSVASSGCASSAGNVFIDCVDPLWKDVSAYEQRKDYQVQGEVYEGTKGQIATWRTTSVEPAHRNVIEVIYRDNNDFNALVHLNSKTDSTDMSAYATGKLVFDIRLLKSGKFNPKLEVLLECGYPCVSHNYSLPSLPIGLWKTIEIPIAQLVEGGLDLNHINMGFEILPEWNKQNGVAFHIDNIRWVKGTEPAPAAVAHCYEQRFETWGLPISLTSFNGAPWVTYSMLRQTIAYSFLQPEWATPDDKVGYAPYLEPQFKPCTLTDGTLSAQVYVDKAYVDDGNLSLGFYYQDGNGYRAWFPPLAAASLQPNSWTTISTPQANANNQPAFSGKEPGFDLSQVTHVGLYLDAHGKNPAVGGAILLDNIFVTGNPISSSSSSSAANCSDVQEYRASSNLGVGAASGSYLFISVSITDATFVNGLPALGLSNTDAYLVYFDGQHAIYQLYAFQNLSADEQLFKSFSYLTSGANASLTTSVYDTLSAAINGYNALDIKTIALPACGASSSAASSTATSSASSSAASSTASSSSSSSSSSSGASSSYPAVCAPLGFGGGIPMGFGLAAGSHGYVSLKLNNATFDGTPFIASTNTTNYLAWNTTNRFIYDLQTGGSNVPGSEVLNVNLNYVVTNPNLPVSLDYRLYDSIPAAVNDTFSYLVSTSYSLVNECH